MSGSFGFSRQSDVDPTRGDYQIFWQGERPIKLSATEGTENMRRSVFSLGFRGLSCNIKKPTLVSPNLRAPQ